MDIKESDSEDEVFMGEITEREMSRPGFNSRRRTTVYFPGISRPDSTISIHEDFTEDGTLIFSFENTEEFGKEHDAHSKCDDVPDDSKSELLSSTEIDAWKLSEKGENKWFNSQASLPNESEMDSGFSSANDGSLTAAVTSPLSLISVLETEKSFQTSEAKMNGTKETLSENGRNKHRHISFSNSLIETAQYQSPFLSGRQHIENLNPLDNSIMKKRDTYYSEAGQITDGVSKLWIESPKQNLASGSETPAVVKDFPVGGAASGCYMSSATSWQHRELPVKRKIAPKSPLAALGTHLVRDTANNAGINCFRTEQKDCSPVSSPSNCDVSGYHSFDLFNVRRKLQKLDFSCGQSQGAAEHCEKEFTGDGNKFSGDDPHNIPVCKLAPPTILVPETPEIKMKKSCDSLHPNLIPCNSHARTGHDDIDFDVVPSSKRTETHTSSSKPAATKPDRCKSSMNHARKETVTLLSESKHVTGMDLFSPGTSPQNSVLSPVPRSTNSADKLKISPPSLQQIQEGQGFRRQPECGGQEQRVPRRRTRRRRNKENMEEEMWSDMPYHSPQQAYTPFLNLEEDSRAAMTRINTMINGERRHILKDLQSSPSSLALDFPPPKQATRVSWNDNLAEEPAVSPFPAHAPHSPRSILQQRPDDLKFPFSEEPPSPILLTRRRIPKTPRLLNFNS